MEDLKEKLINYCDEIVKGKILACEAHKQAVERFFIDLEDDGLCVDWGELHKIYSWARFFRYTTGVVAGQEIELTPYQLFILCNIFCVKDKETGRRKYRKFYIQVGRKNAKTQLMAIIGSYYLFNSPHMEEIYIAGWILKQSKLCFDEITRLLNTCKYLEGKYAATKGSIIYKKTGSKIEALTRESRKRGDGLNPSMAIIDEYHCHDTNEILQVLDSGMLARQDPLLIIITTAGSDLNVPCYEEYKYSKRVLNGEYTDDSYFALICELEEKDDVKDIKKWIKANPIACSYQTGIENIKSKLIQSLDNPSQLRDFLTKNMNKWVSMREAGYMDLNKWEDCSSNVTLESLRGCDVWLGVDLSSTLDLTSIGIIAIKDEKFHVISHSFSPTERIVEKVRKERVPYYEWEKAGYITFTPGEVVNYIYIIDYINNIKKEYNFNIKEICFDPWNANMLGAELLSQGYICVEIRQGIRTLGEPTKVFREKVYNKEVVHDSNPILKWAVSNAIIDMDTNGNFKISKKASTQKVDPLAAVINAFTRAVHFQYTRPFIAEVWSF